MDNITAQLLQIQNLELTVRENTTILQRIKNNQIYKDIKEKIVFLKQEIPSDILSVYEKLTKQSKVRVIPILNDTCTGCFMKLTVEIAKEIKLGRDVVTCPNCNRFLYYEKIVQSSQYNSDCPGIAKFSAPDLMFPAHKNNFKDKFDAISKIGSLICNEMHIKNEQNVVDALIKREKILSTAIGDGIAFPHARGNFGGGLTFAITTIKEGFNFDDNRIVYLIITFLIPTHVNKFYLETASHLVRYFSKKSCFDKIIASVSAQEMWNIVSEIKS